MLAFLRLLFFGFIFLTVIYVSVSLWARSVREEKLRREWDAGARPGDRDAYIEAGMAQYRTSLRRRLILLVYVVPVVFVVAVIYVTNFM
ncbi:hypothetical protein [Roseovarius sp. SYSU LYC5161]|uniref:hypothetical protein n=1 Tax=Roseovarius halophilus (ex Wu et al. 2025) TaxID=3376060 RepID=UPI00399A1170